MWSKRFEQLWAVYAVVLGAVPLISSIDGFADVFLNNDAQRGFWEHFGGLIIGTVEFAVLCLWALFVRNSWHAEVTQWANSVGQDDQARTAEADRSRESGKQELDELRRPHGPSGLCAESSHDAGRPKPDAATDTSSRQSPKDDDYLTQLESFER